MQRRCRRAGGAKPRAGRGAAAGVGRPCGRLGLCVFLPGGFRAGGRGECSCRPLRVWWGRPARDTVQSPLRRTLEAPAAGGWGAPAWLRPPPLHGRWGTAGCSMRGGCGRPSLPRCASRGALELLGAPAGERPASWLDRWDSQGRDSGRVAYGCREAWGAGPWLAMVCALERGRPGGPVPWRLFYLPGRNVIESTGCSSPRGLRV